MYPQSCTYIWYIDLQSANKTVYYAKFSYAVNLYTYFLWQHYYFNCVRYYFVTNFHSTKTQIESPYCLWSVVHVNINMLLYYCTVIFTTHMQYAPLLWNLEYIVVSAFNFKIIIVFSIQCNNCNISSISSQYVCTVR